MDVIDAEDTSKCLISQDFKHITFLSDYNFVCRNTPKSPKSPKHQRGNFEIWGGATEHYNSKYNLIRHE